MMIKQFIQTATKISLISSVAILGNISSNLKSLALPTQEINKKLQVVPVFAILNSQGKPLIGQVNNQNKKQSVSYVFVTQSDANNFLNNLKTKNPGVAKLSHVAVLPLSSVYQTQISQPKSNGVAFLFIPNAPQVQEAKKMGSVMGQPYKWGVPLFVILNSKNKGYLVISSKNNTKSKNNSEIPLFFSKTEAQALFDKVKKANPKIGTDLVIGIIPLEGVLGKMKDNNPLLSKFVFVPLPEAVTQAKALRPSGK